MCVCLSVCLSVKSHLTYGASVRPENAVTYSAGNAGQKIVGICLKRLRSRVMPRKMSEKANMLIIPTYRCQLSLLDTQRRTRGYLTIVNNIQPCPKLCLLMPLARVGARTDSTTRLLYSYNARRGQLPRTYTVSTKEYAGLEQDMQYAPRVCTLVLFIVVRYFYLPHWKYFSEI